MSMYCKTCDRIIEEDDRNQCGECMKNDAKAVEMVAAFKPLADAAAEHDKAVGEAMAYKTLAKYDAGVIARLTTERDAVNEELAIVRMAARRDFDRAGVADDYERILRDIGRISGCDHLDERLPHCIRETIDAALAENGRLREALDKIEHATNVPPHKLTDTAFLRAAASLAHEFARLALAPAPAAKESHP